MRETNSVFSEIKFDQDDQNLFQIDDLRLKADAIRHSILPKLHALINQAILQIKDVYGLEALEDSHILQSPNFRLKRDNELKIDYRWAVVGVTGKRGKGMWHGFKRNDGKPVQIVPFEYAFVITEEGLGIYLRSHRVTGVSKDSCSKLLRFHLEFENVIHTLSYNLGIFPILFWGDGCEPFTSFTKHYEWMFKNRIMPEFRTRNFGFPIAAIDLANRVNAFTLFYPVYDSYIRIVKGEMVRFEQLIQTLNEWWKKEDEKRTETPPAKEFAASSLTDETLQKAKETAEQRIKVLPAMRWQVFQRDNWRCVACGRRAGDDSNIILHIDHILPRSRGGKDILDNFQTLCSKCNIGKSNKNSTDLRR